MRFSSHRTSVYILMAALWHPRDGILFGAVLCPWRVWNIYLQHRTLGTRVIHLHIFVSRTVVANDLTSWDAVPSVGKYFVLTFPSQYWFSPYLFVKEIPFLLFGKRKSQIWGIGRKGCYSRSTCVYDIRQRWFTYVDFLVYEDRNNVYFQVLILIWNEHLLLLETWPLLQL